ncbi:hypothetical protein ANN_12810 [Periplaneta americana]|uniref:Uncharacterized protein n=1 Tax=Periplaneta americana TaxID=6978 RepID=A0ABQ8TJT2_PERAM|nr:hypothetical protein ANN_12810 [Periplaneta americana]
MRNTTRKNEIEQEIKHLEVQNKVHLAKAQTFYQRKNKSKNRCRKSEEVESLVMDYQKNLPTPNISLNITEHMKVLFTWLFNDAVSTTNLFSVDGIGDSEMIFGDMRSRIRHRLPDICLTISENFGKKPKSFFDFCRNDVDGYGVSCFNNSVSVDGDDTDDEENGTSEKTNPKNANLTFYTEMFNQQQDLAVADLSENEDECTDVVDFELMDEEEPNILVPGYVSGESPSTQFVCESTKRQECVLEDHDEQVADQPYPKHVRWAKCLANVQARKAVIPIVLRRRLTQSSPHVTGHCPGEI